MYESPIEIMYGEMKMQVVDNVVKAVQEQQIHVDREELIKALLYDRGSYENGYVDALNEMIFELENGQASAPKTVGEITDRLQEKAVKFKNKYIGGVE
jgi:hypothetical protein